MASIVTNDLCCQTCRKTYRSASAFIKHLCKPKEKKLSQKTCYVCNKAFKTNEHLRQHERCHSGEKPYLCMTCGRAFSQQGNLIKHQRIHDGSRQFLCEFCSRPFMTKGALNEHLRIHRNEKGFRCEKCDKYFRHKHGLVNHQRKRKYPCSIRRYGEKKSRKKVKRLHSNQKGSHEVAEVKIDCVEQRIISQVTDMNVLTPLSSDTSNAVSPDPGVNNHLVKIHDEQLIYGQARQDSDLQSSGTETATICTDIIHNSKALNQNTITENQNNESEKMKFENMTGWFQKQKLTGLTQLSKRNITVSRSTQQNAVLEMSEDEVLKIIKKAKCKDFTCKDCRKSFANEYCLSVHSCKAANRNISKDRLKQRKYCSHCKKCYANKYLLKSHSCKTNIQKEKFSCKTRNRPYCNRRDRNMSKQFECKKKCEMVETVVEKYDSCLDTSHKTTEAKHKNGKTENADYKHVAFQSEKSDKTAKVGDYDQISDLPTSKMICETCGKTYKNKTNLKNHSCKPPSKESKTCSICNKTFNLKAHLQIHMRIHTKEMPFLCKTCGKLFNQRANLMKHMRIHDPLKMFQCEICLRRFTQKGALTEHRIVHTNIKAYACPKCNKSFRHKHGLQSHLNRKFSCDLKRKGKQVIEGSLSRQDNINSMIECARSSQTINTNAIQLNKISKEQYDFKRASNIEVRPESVKVIMKEVYPFPKPEGQFSSVQNFQTFDESYSDISTNLSDKESSENRFTCSDESKQPVLMESSQRSEDCELFPQQSQAGYVSSSSFGDQTGWISLNYKLAEL